MQKNSRTASDRILFGFPQVYCVIAVYLLQVTGVESMFCLADECPDKTSNIGFTAGVERTGDGRLNLIFDVTVTSSLYFRISTCMF